MDRWWKVLLVLAVLGILFGLTLTLRELSSTYPDFIEPGTTYWQVKLPTLLPGLAVTITSLFISIIALVLAIKNRQKVRK